MGIQKKCNDIWVLSDLRTAPLFDASLKVLGKAVALARAADGKAVLVLPGANQAVDRSVDSDTCVLPQSAAEHAAAHGADLIYCLDLSCNTIVSPGVFAKALMQLIPQKGPALVLAPMTDHGRETAATASALCQGGLIADCHDLRYEQGRFCGVCSAWGGDIVCEIGFNPDHAQRVGFATVQPHACEKCDQPGRPGQVEVVPVAMGAVAQTAQIQRIAVSNELPKEDTLEMARRVVVGGAGLQTAEGFGLARQLAGAIGGQLGATRPPVMQHWVDETRLIGQTGKQVRPDLLIAVGTSGAMQFTAGITGTRTIVAINRDKQAPIFQVADIGVIADARVLLPKLIEKAQQQAMERLGQVLCNDGQEKAGVSPAGLGGQIRQLRQSREWSRERLGELTQQSAEFIAQVEEDTISPPVSFLLRLASALKVSPAAFLSREAQTMITDQRQQAHQRRTQHYSYESLTAGIETDHLRAFMVTIEPLQAHKPAAYKHPGEEFIFVMDGELELTLDRQASRIKKGESIHFNADTPHTLKSLSESPTRCLVVLYTP
jgi:electron transfer flavoprotein alpha subunit